MSRVPEPYQKPDRGLDGDGLAFLHDEGLEMLSLYRAITNPHTRLMLRDLTRAIAASQSTVILSIDGDGQETG